MLVTINALLSYQSFCWWGNLQKAPHSLRMGLRTSAPPASSAMLEIKTLAKPLAQGRTQLVRYSGRWIAWGRLGGSMPQLHTLPLISFAPGTTASCVLYKELEYAKQAGSQGFMSLLSHYRIQSWRV